MARPEYPSDASDKILLRLPDGLRERIKIRADFNKRSMNSEIVATLDHNYPELPTLKRLSENLRSSLLYAIEHEDEHGAIELAKTIKFTADFIEAKERSKLFKP